MLVSNQRVILRPHTYPLESITHAAPSVVPPKRGGLIFMVVLTALWALFSLVRGTLRQTHYRPTRAPLRRMCASATRRYESSLMPPGRSGCSPEGDCRLRVRHRGQA
jgi:hypothetical protein